MKDRFDFLEFGSEPSASPAEAEAETPGTPWKPLRLRVVEEVGERGKGAGQFMSPTGLSVDLWGALYVADSENHRVQRITPDGTVTVFGRPGSAAGEMWSPQAVAVDPSGQFVFVAEQGSQRIQCFNFTGQPRGVMSGFRAPSGTAFDSEGRLWVADTGNSRLMRLDVQTGQFLAELGSGFGIRRPVSLACSGKTLFVTESAGNNVVAYAFDGKRGAGLGDHRRLHDPAQVALDSEQRLYVTEPGANRLHVFDAQGDSLYVFDTLPASLGTLRAPSGVALGTSGEIYLADTGNCRVLRLAWE